MESLRTYVLTAVGLWVLLAMTVAVSFLPLESLETVLTLAIAIAKAVLVAIFFMHLRGAGGLVRLFAVAGVFWLLLLMALTLADFLTRQPPQIPVHP